MPTEAAGSFAAEFQRRVELLAMKHWRERESRPSFSRPRLEPDLTRGRVALLDENEQDYYGDSTWKAEIYYYPTAGPGCLIATYYEMGELIRALDAVDAD